MANEGQELKEEQLVPEDTPNSLGLKETVNEAAPPKIQKADTVNIQNDGAQQTNTIIEKEKMDESKVEEMKESVNIEGMKRTPPSHAESKETQSVSTTAEPTFSSIAKVPLLKSSTKVKVHFVAVGCAPLMKKNKFQIDGDQRFAAVNTFLRKVLKLQRGDALFLYSSSAFVPSPDALVGEVNDAFSVRGELVLHYSLQEAWG